MKGLYSGTFIHSRISFTNIVLHPGRVKDPKVKYLRKMFLTEPIVLSALHS
jgi:hypothetical protein